MRPPQPLKLLRLFPNSAPREELTDTLDRSVRKAVAPPPRQPVSAYPPLGPSDGGRRTPTAVSPRFAYAPRGCGPAG